ncbi:hypothetical protein GDO81_028604 [Engystomops pustulosus]|uniref:Uncharacterized protein n=1 Tax=Engystomops pustulosus TaxID=76066 RepID=A0AAV6Z6R7_ENGPU|nr:hypothetical protein GDO81_028604 [Engystomops pustulosus]
MYFADEYKDCNIQNISSRLRVFLNFTKEDRWDQSPAPDSLILSSKCTRQGLRVSTLKVPVGALGPFLGFRVAGSLKGASRLHPPSSPSVLPWDLNLV